MDKHKKSTSSAIMRKLNIFLRPAVSNSLKMEICRKTTDGLFQSSRVIMIVALHFPIRTCMQNFSQFLRVQFGKSHNLFLKERVRLCLSRQGLYPAAKESFERVRRANTDACNELVLKKRIYPEKETRKLSCNFLEVKDCL